VITIRNGQEILIPDEAGQGVSSRTTLFYIDTDDVDVAIEPVPVLPA
jgi:hypothetical protein